MSTFDPKQHKLHRGKSVSLCSVAGGMSGLSLLPPLSGMLSSIAFFDSNAQELAKAELWVALIRMSPSRNKFLERLYSKKAFDDLAKFTPQSMAELLKNAPFDKRIFNETETELYCESTGLAVKLYQQDVARHVGQRSNNTDRPRMWPSWQEHLPEHKYGHVYENASKLHGKVGTLWLNQAGYMKNEHRYQHVRHVLLSTPVNFRVLDLNEEFTAQDMGLLDDVPVVMFTSDTLKLSKWVADLEHGALRRFQEAFPRGGLLLQTQAHPPSHFSVTTI